MLFCPLICFFFLPAFSVWPYVLSSLLFCNKNTHVDEKLQLGKHRAQAAREIFTPQTMAVIAWSGGYGQAFMPPLLSDDNGEPQRRADSGSARRELLRRTDQWKDAWSTHVVTEWGYFCFLLQACAHRWKNVFYDNELILPHGYCSVIPSTLQEGTIPLIPCYEGITEKQALLILRPKNCASEFLHMKIKKMLVLFGIFIFYIFISHYYLQLHGFEPDLPIVLNWL